MPSETRPVFQTAFLSRTALTANHKYKTIRNCFSCFFKQLDTAQADPLGGDVSVTARIPPPQGTAIR
ncbi:TPA: hypothetical protein WHE72_000841 [Neisseria meningitidis]